MLKLMRKTPHEQSYERKYIFLKTEIFFKVLFLEKVTFHLKMKLNITFSIKCKKKFNL